MTEELFRVDGYLRACNARVVRVDADTGGIVLDRTVFYPLGGGQAGDSGTLELADGTLLAVADTRKAKDAEGKTLPQVLHIPAAGQEALLVHFSAGVDVVAHIDWERRHKLMRFHTATHLLCHLVPAPVNGCSITPDYARLDFHMTDPLEKEALTEGLTQLVGAAHPLVVGSVTDAELDADPTLVKSMSVQPPRGSGTVRTIRIGSHNGPAIDLQPCGGTHVANTSEIGAVLVTKIEKKSANTRRVVLGWAG